MEYLEQNFTIPYSYKVYFSKSLFAVSNPLLLDFFSQRLVDGMKQKILFVLDLGVVEAFPNLKTDIKAYFDQDAFLSLSNEMVVIPGGEDAKNDPACFDQLMNAVHEHGIDRHSYIAAIGGGAVLDLAGFVAAIAHRGIRHIRIPTTVLSQNDSGVGVKNGINYFNKKNFLGSFVPPLAVFNDSDFLLKLSDRNWRSGIAEAIKVALIKDAVFFDWIESNCESLSNRNLIVMNELIKRCAKLHLAHISGGDPFELGSSRPLDFGHWSAHKLEQLTNFNLLHGEAVAMGIALDTVYSHLKLGLPETAMKRILQVLVKLGFPLTHPLMQFNGNNSEIIKGLQEFQEHLGGRLTIMLLHTIGSGIEVHEIDKAIVQRAGEYLAYFE